MDFFYSKCSQNWNQFQFHLTSHQIIHPTKNIPLKKKSKSISHNFGEQSDKSITVNKRCMSEERKMIMLTFVSPSKLLCSMWYSNLKFKWMVFVPKMCVFEKKLTWLMNQVEKKWEILINISLWRIEIIKRLDLKLNDLKINEILLFTFNISSKMKLSCFFSRFSVTLNNIR